MSYKLSQLSTEDIEQLRLDPKIKVLFFEGDLYVVNPEKIILQRDHLET